MNAGAARRRCDGAARLGAVAAVLCLGAPAPASAHLVSTGLGPFYDGVLHFAVTPADLLPALAFGLLAGQRGAAAGRRSCWLLPVAWLAGGLVGTSLPALPAEGFLALSLLVLGGLVAADARLPLAWLSFVGASAGVLHGLHAGAAIAPAGGGIPGIAGTVCGVAVVTALAAARVVSLHTAWARVAVRVAGSWIAATGLLLVGWALRAHLAP
jgi:hydrogenase/urease accessory protein HupE